MSQPLSSSAPEFKPSPALYWRTKVAAAAEAATPKGRINRIMRMNAEERKRSENEAIAEAVAINTRNRVAAGKSRKARKDRSASRKGLSAYRKTRKARSAYRKAN